MPAADVILLSDVTSSLGSTTSRYCGPYVLSTRLEHAGFNTVVIDYFTRHPDFFGYLEGFLGQNTMMLGLSSTFLSPYEPELSIERLRRREMRGERNERYYRDSLWHLEEPSMQEWFIRLKQVLSRRSPKCRIVLGGAKAPLIYQRPLAMHRFFDYIVLGQADDSIVDLARCFKEGRTPAHTVRNGVAFLQPQPGALQGCPSAQLTDKHAILRGEGLPIEISRGCLYNCKFCYYDKKESIRKNLDALRSELIRNYENFGSTVYHFCDDCFNDTKDKVEGVCGLLLNLPFKVEWVSYARADLHVKFPETLDLMVKAGCRSLQYGIETFNPEAGKAAGKAVPPIKVKEFFKTAYQRHNSQVIFNASFIVGLPHETPDSQRETTSWLTENRVFDFVSYGGLGLTKYEAGIDGAVVDYSDYSRNPGRYGFKEIRFEPDYYWRHETMDLVQARELAIEGLKLIAACYGSPYFMSTFMYPRMRSLDFNHEDILDMARQSDEANGRRWKSQADSRMEEWLGRYWDLLLKINTSLSGAGRA